MLDNFFKKYKYNKSFKDIINLSGVQIALRPLQFLKSFVVAKYLGPEVFGILKSVELISMLNKFGSLGFKPAIIRNVTTAKARGDNLEVENTKNNAFTGELFLSLFLFIIGLSSSLFFEDKLISIAIILASIGLFTAKLLGIFQTELQLNKKFGSLGKIILYQGIINSLVVILTVPFYTIYSVLIVPSISSIIVTFLAYRMTGKFFSLSIDKIGFLKILKVSIPLTMGTLAFGLFRYTERFLIISYLGLTAVGFFGFADTIVGIFISLLLGSVLKVRGIKIFEELGKENHLKLHKMIVKETKLLILMSFGFIILIAVGMKLFIPIVLPKWEAAINITILFSFVIPLKLASSYIAFVIKSPTVNKLKFAPIMQLVATGVLLSGIIVLKHHDCLNLTNFILVDIVAYSVLHITTILFYYKVYYLKFIYLNA